MCLSVLCMSDFKGESMVTKREFLRIVSAIKTSCVQSWTDPQEEMNARSDRCAGEGTWAGKYSKFGVSKVPTWLHIGQQRAEPETWRNFQGYKMSKIFLWHSPICCEMSRYIFPPSDWVSCVACVGGRRKRQRNQKLWIMMQARILSKESQKSPRPLSCPLWGI